MDEDELDEFLEQVDEVCEAQVDRMLLLELMDITGVDEAFD